MNIAQEEKIRSLWEKNVDVDTPNVFFCDSPPELESTVLYTVDDSKSVYRFITEKAVGRAELMVVKSKCTVVPATDTTAAYYKVAKGAFHHVSCYKKSGLAYEDKFTKEEKVAINIIEEFKLTFPQS